ncbi:hypothetical protein ACWCWD_29600 [Streptomyces sp. NPDC001493]
MQKDEFAELAHHVAASLTVAERSWWCVPDTSWECAARMRSSDGREIVLILTGRSVTARGMWGRGIPPRFGPPSPEVSMAADGATYVAGHIRRRLLPRYEVVFARWLELEAEAEAEKAARRVVAERIAGSLGPGLERAPGSVEVTHEDKLRQSAVDRRSGRVHMRFLIGRGGNEIEVSVSGLAGVQAEALGALLAYECGELA